MFAALDHPARQGLSGDVEAVAAEHLLEAIQRNTVDILGAQRHRQHAGAGQALLYHLSGFISSDRGGFAALAGVCLADVFDHPHLHRDDFQLLAGFFTNHLLAAAAFAGQFLLWQFVDDLQTPRP